MEKLLTQLYFYIIIVVLAYLTSNEAGRRQLHTPSLNPGPPEPVWSGPPEPVWSGLPDPVCPGILRGLKVYVRGF